MHFNAKTDANQSICVFNRTLILTKFVMRILEEYIFSEKKKGK